MPSAKRMIKKTRSKAGYRRPKKQFKWGEQSIDWYARHAWSGVRMLKGLINVEKKFIDTDISGTPGTTAQVIGLCSLAQGTTDSTRNGDSILAKYLTINEKITINANATTDVFRVVYVLDKENRGAAPGYTDIFDGSGTMSRLNKNNMDRFVILSDKAYALDQNGRASISHKIYKKLDFHIKYSGTVGDTTDYRQNTIFRVVLADDNANKATSIANCRIAFYDN